MGLTFLKLGTYAAYGNQSKLRIVTRELAKRNLLVIKIREATKILSNLEQNEELYLDDITPTHVVVASFKLGRFESRGSVFIAEAQSKRPVKTKQAKPASKINKKGPKN